MKKSLTGLMAILFSFTVLAQGNNQIANIVEQNIIKIEKEEAEIVALEDKISNLEQIQDVTGTISYPLEVISGSAAFLALFSVTGFNMNSTKQLKAKVVLLFGSLAVLAITYTAESIIIVLTEHQKQKLSKKIIEKKNKLAAKKNGTKRVTKKFKLKY